MTDRQPHHAPRTAQTSPPDPEAELEQFLYIVTHDLRAAFRAFQTIPEWIAEDMGPLPPERQEALSGHLEMLTTQAARCDRMLLDLRDYSRIGRRADPTVEHGLKEVLERALRLFPLPGGFDLAVLGEARVVGPLNELALLLSALLSNAVKHHDRAEGQITLTAAPGPDGMVRLSVIDDGPGIPEKFREAVFDLLRTLRPRDSCEGSGMGLSLARRIVTRAGGSIAIRDTGAERGTTVDFTLPGHAPEPASRLN